MNYLLKLYQKYSVKKICRKYGITNYTVNPDGSVDVKGSVNLSHKNLNRLPLKFGKVSGNFYCYNNQLTTLEGCPTEVGGDFNCSYNQLTTLEGCPKTVGGNFYCSYNQLTTLEGCPTSVGGDFYCHYNQLTTLEGCPTEVGGDFFCPYNQLTTLEGCPTSVGGFFCYGNPLPKEIIYNPKAFLKILNRDKIINELLTKTLPEI
jgi:hypothetical protein